MDFLLSQSECQFGIVLSQSERTYKKMNEYFMEMKLCTKDNLSDEEFMMEVSSRKLHANKKKRLQKEKHKYGKSITYQGRIF